MSNTLITALATPFVNGKIHWSSYEKLINFQLENEVDALLATGTTAESISLSNNEKAKLIAVARKICADKPLHVGICADNVSTAKRQAKIAQDNGADTILIAPPSFCKCTNIGYLNTVFAVLNAVTIPIALYNVPGRTCYALDQTTIKTLSQNLAYVKDAGNDLRYTKQLSANVKVLCGNDKLLYKSLQNGAAGVISVVSNVAPILSRQVLDGKRNKTFEKLASVCAMEVNPVAIKYILQRKGIFVEHGLRPPLGCASAKTRQAISKLNWEEIR